MIQTVHLHLVPGLEIYEIILPLYMVMCLIKYRCNTNSIKQCACVCERERPLYFQGLYINISLISVNLNTEETFGGEILRWIFKLEISQIQP
jgi:hypothetical protein